jgi:hypothetical protein
VGTPLALLNEFLPLNRSEMADVVEYVRKRMELKQSIA